MICNVFEWLHPSAIYLWYLALVRPKIINDVTIFLWQIHQHGNFRMFYSGITYVQAFWEHYSFIVRSGDFWSLIMIMCCPLVVVYLLGFNSMFFFSFHIIKDSITFFHPILLSSMTAFLSLFDANMAARVFSDKGSTYQLSFLIKL